MGLFHRKNQKQEAVAQDTQDQGTLDQNNQDNSMKQERPDVTIHTMSVKDEAPQGEIEKIVVQVGSEQASQSEQTNPADFTYEHKNELGMKYILTMEMPSKESVEECSIQELSFLMKTVMMFQENREKESHTSTSEVDDVQAQEQSQEPSQDQSRERSQEQSQNQSQTKEDFMNKFNLFHEVFLEKVTNAEALYIMINPLTEYPLIDGDGYVWLFSTEKMAQMAKNHFEETGVKLIYQEIPHEKIKPYFADLYTWGMENILMDMGGYIVPLKRGEILPPPDYSKMPEVQQPVMNPALTRHMLTYLQIAFTRKKGDTMSDAELGVLNHVIGDIAQAKFLCPVQYDNKDDMKPDQDGKVVLKKDATVRFAFATNRNGEKALPVFTDWNMFHKMYDDKEWNGQIVTYKDVVALAGDNVIVINPMGIEFHITRSLREPLQKAYEYFTSQK